MQHDDVIWRNVNQGFCSFKVKTEKQNFCRNKYNITGLCSRASCPLANSRYATICESGDALYLFVKTAERAHSPRNLWEQIKLSRNYRAALAQIDKHLEFWPEFYIHKAKQRLTKMVQYHIRRRRIALRTKTRLVGVKKKIERRERTREAKAATAAKLDKAIEKELLERLRSGTYGDIYNFPQNQYEKVLEDEGEVDEVSSDEYEEEDDGEFDDEYASAEEYEAEYEDDSDEADIEEGQGDANGGTRYDFDDGDGESGPDDPVEDPRAYVRERARRRAASSKHGLDGVGRKGRPLRRGDRIGREQVETEYEHERAAQRASR